MSGTHLISNIKDGVASFDYGKIFINLANILFMFSKEKIKDKV